MDVSMNPLPTTLEDLVDQLNNDPAFSAAFTASPGARSALDGTSVNENLIVTAKEGGAGDISVVGIPNTVSKEQKRAGRNEIPATPEIPARGRGYGSEDILGAIDVTREAGSLTTTTIIPAFPGGTIGGTSPGFGTIRETPVITLPPTPRREETHTDTWNSGAYDAIIQIDRAIAIVSKGRAEMGATENALDHTIRSVSVSAENLALSESRIRDADMAKEIVDLQRWQILAQASMQMLSQANMVPQSVLKLLQ
ncbi:flagellin [Kineosphaera limosa]|uniref:flagellin n=1 Tax=Kineosphaera limosa TaxID=111564 RepID=UPI0002EB0DE2|nr:flagellin [Kineosphaera limosa]